MRDLRYIEAACRRMGVPGMWVEDAVQDVLLKCWLADDDRKILIERGAVDAARRYGAFTRRGILKAPKSLDALVDQIDKEEHPNPNQEYLHAPDEYAMTDRLIDFRQAWARLSRIQRRHIRRAVAGGYTRYEVTYQARLRLRALVA